MMARRARPARHPAADRIAAECIAVRVRLLNRTITGIYDDALRPLGLTAGQLNILVVVARRAPVAPGEIARYLNMEKSTVSRNIDRMREHGWLAVQAGTTGRDQLIELRAKGRKLLDRSLPRWTEAQARARAVLGQRGAESILRIGDAVWSQGG